MSMQNAEIAALFNRLADLLELEDANPFRVRAYRTAARTITGLSRQLADLLAEGRPGRTAGHRQDLADKIRTLVTTGRLPLLGGQSAHPRSP
jgi:DNA polymerase (family 10)